MNVQATTASTGARARVGRAARTPNELLTAILAGDHQAIETAPQAAWDEAISIAHGFHSAQYCAMKRGDHQAREALLRLMNRWAAVECHAVQLDVRAGLIRL